MHSQSLFNNEMQRRLGGEREGGGWSREWNGTWKLEEQEMRTERPSALAPGSTADWLWL